MKIRLIIITIAFLNQYGVSAFQQGPLRELNQQLQSYYEQQVPLKVHLFLNQPKYLAGDTIFFKATVVHANSLKLLERNTLLNICLVNQNGHSVFFEKIRLKDGEASNQLVVPDSLAPGKYMLIAYHDWMRSVTSGSYYQEQIEIAGEREFETPHGSKNFNFYPEGGRLIAGTNNRIVVKGLPMTEGKIKDSSGSELASFRTDADGVGTFYLRPEKSEHYFAEVSGDPAKKQLPDPAIEGLAVSVSIDQSQLQVMLRQSPEAFYSKVRVVVTSQTDIYYSTALDLKDNHASVHIPLYDIPPGVAQVTVFSENGSLLAERLFFDGRLPSMETEFNGIQEEYAPRQKISFGIKVLDGNGKPVKSKIAVTVFNKTVLATEEAKPNSIIDNLLLYSDLSRNAKNSHFVLTHDTTGWLKKLDRDLITEKWIRYSWNDVLDKNRKPVEHPYDLRFTGEVVSEKTGAIITDTTFVAFFLQKNVLTFQSFTQKGRFDMPLFQDFYGDDEVFYRVEKRGKLLPDAKVIIHADTIRGFQGERFQPSSKINSYYTQGQRKRLIGESFEFYQKKSDYKKISSLNAKIEEEVFGADEEIDLEKYLLLPTMEETIREIIPFVQHRKNKNESVVRVFLVDLDRLATEDPVYVIDGVMTNDTHYFLSLKPSEVSEIKIINSRDKLITFGAIARNGMILVETKIPDHAAKMPRSTRSFQVHGLNEPVSIRISNPTTQSLRVPDLRTSLYWNPDVITNENGEATISFYASDVTGEFEIKVEGMTSSGMPFYKNGSFKVVFKPGSH